MATWFYLLVLWVNGEIYVHPMGPFDTEVDCNTARSVNIPEKYTVLDITKCVQKPKEV